MVVDERLAALKSSNELRLRCGPGDVAACLATVAGVAAVAADGDAWRVTLEPDLAPDLAPAADASNPAAVDAMAERIAQALSGAGVGLRELTTVQRDLEAVFREVNEGDQHAA